MEGVGCIKLPRTIKDSDTFKSLNAIQKIIAIYILLEANHEDGVWHDKYKNVSVPLKRGQLITSRKKIVTEWFDNDKDITEQKVRTALNKLEKTGFLTMESTKHYTLLTVRNYAVYQEQEKETNQGSNPRSNQVLNTHNEVDAPDNPFNAYQMYFGKSPSPFIVQQINQYIDAGLEQELISLAFSKATNNGKDFVYARGILNRWEDEGICTANQALEIDQKRLKKSKGEKNNGASSKEIMERYKNYSFR